MAMLLTCTLPINWYLGVVLILAWQSFWNISTICGDIPPYSCSCSKRNWIRLQCKYCLSLFLIGIFYSPPSSCKVKMEMEYILRFLEDFFSIKFEDLNYTVWTINIIRLLTEGLGNKRVQFKLWCQDAVAHNESLGLINHNGYESCPTCREPGQRFRLEDLRRTNRQDYEKRNLFFPGICNISKSL